VPPVYWASAHDSKVMQRGARVLASHGDLTGIDHVAAKNLDGSYVIVSPTIAVWIARHRAA
jgi:hypothetical protein